MRPHSGAALAVLLALLGSCRAQFVGWHYAVLNAAGTTATVRHRAAHLLARSPASTQASPRAHTITPNPTHGRLTRWLTLTPSPLPACLPRPLQIVMPALNATNPIDPALVVVERSADSSFSAPTVLAGPPARTPVTANVLRLTDPVSSWPDPTGAIKPWYRVTLCLNVSCVGTDRWVTTPAQPFEQAGGWRQGVGSQLCEGIICGLLGRGFLGGSGGRRKCLWAAWGIFRERACCLC